MCSPRLPTLAPMRPDRCRGGGGDPAGRGAVDRDGIPDVHDGIHHDGPHLHARGTISFILTVSELRNLNPTHPPTSQNCHVHVGMISLALASAACFGSAGPHTHTYTHRAHAPHAPVCCTRRRSAPPPPSIRTAAHCARCPFSQKGLNVDHDDRRRGGDGGAAAVGSAGQRARCQCLPPHHRRV